ncbi:unnamed protein product [Rotaria magnacalcarata]|uniref:Reverse transcriptase domain-containing protein n=1 Tax=Rotaria magnacalcarata TaxID=392030 RepID=A0A816UH86_9BILA|nr:unnamed protein product [Rotaria magnacalcarata]CAF1651424.1 unnamed protein product [Rotaria magnacalcarata]CAF2114117.1 unnamed protein product [Rotaria magnacalcarata]CAF3919381.1 unnamed protein product [Rotaria magnacalcarata]CAF3928384.1 unnamed protein product [Rotaria magnacalcarata]
MNINIDNDIETIKTHSEDAQGCSYELQSSTKVLTEQEQRLVTPTTIKKKKVRNRKLQRYWRKLRKQGLDEATIRMYKLAHQLQEQDQIHDVEMEEIISLNHTKNLPGPYNPQRKRTKRKRDESTKQNSTKKKKRSTSSLKIQEQEQERQEEKENDRENEENPMNKQTISFHYYLNATDQKLKKMLKAAFVDGKDILTWCQSKENLHYLREHTRLVDRVHYLKLEEDLWENYTIYGETYHCWVSPLSKKILKDNQLKSDYKISKKSTEKYRERIKQQKQEAEEEVQRHALLLKDYQHQDSNVDEQSLWATILALVRKGQHKLSQNYQHRKKYFKNSAKDYSLVKSCYDYQPTKEEVISMQVIWQATANECKSQQNVDILKQHLFMKRIPKSLDYLDQSLSTMKHKLAKPIYNDKIRTTILTRHKKIIAQNKADLMAVDISIAEAAVRGYHQYSEDEKNKLANRMKQDPLRQPFIEQFIQAIEQRQTHIRQYMEYLTQRRIRFFYHRSDDRRQNWFRRSYHLNLYWDILPSSSIIEADIKLTPEQLALLSRGPKYVPPCQSRFYKKEVRNKMIQEEYQNIITKITDFFRQYSYCISKKRINEFSDDLKNLLQRLYTKKLSRKLSVRAKREHKLMISIRRYLRKYQHVILRRTDKSKVFHLGDGNDYQRKVLEYMQETEAYEEITSGISPLATNLRQVISLLNHLYHAEKPLITKKQYEAMYPKENDTELGHLYFLPKPHKIGTPLRPIVAAIHAPAMLVSTYLNNLLRPIFNHVARKTIYNNSIDPVKQLETYQKQGYLLTSTQFITIDVKNLYTMIPQAGALDALHRFCMKHATELKFGNLTVNTIIRLVCLVLDTNYFVFNNKYYKQIRGGAMGSPLTMTLANIYMYEWEQSLIQHQQARHELYGRYIDDIFMTSNESIDTIKALLDRENEKDPNIRISCTIHDSVEFLDVLIENRQGQLKTSVFRKPAAEPYILPYTSDHPRHIHMNTAHTALLRGLRLCSDVQTFDQERLNIEIALLLNGYPPKFIQRCFQKFFKKNNVTSIYKDLHEETFQQFHVKLLNECQVKDHSSEQPQQQQQQKSNKNEIDQKDNGKSEKKRRQLIIHYTYESGPLKTFNRVFRTIWEKHFCYTNSPLNNVRVILGTRINKTLDHLLVKKKPPRILLRTNNGLPESSTT